MEMSRDYAHFVTRERIKMNRTLFLDADGVINNFDTPYLSEFAIDPTLLKRVWRIVNMTGATIVISSSWRFSEDFGLPKLRHALNDLGIYDIGETPVIEWGKNRNEEISAFLKAFQPSRSVVLDDDKIGDIECPLGSEEVLVIKCNPRVGLTDEEARQAIDFLSSN
mgnify:CR=1 FL=1